MTERVQIKVPDIGDFHDVEVIEILVKPGDAVRPEQSLITLESDKASMEIPSPMAGIVRELRVKLNDEWRTPRYIETVPGEGYRFKSQAALSDAAK